MHEDVPRKRVCAKAPPMIMQPGDCDHLAHSVVSTHCQGKRCICAIASRGIAISTWSGEDQSRVSMSSRCSLSTVTPSSKWIKILIETERNSVCVHNIDIRRLDAIKVWFVLTSAMLTSCFSISHGCSFDLGWKKNEIWTSFFWHKSFLCHLPLFSPP